LALAVLRFDLCFLILVPAAQRARENFVEIEGSEPRETVAETLLKEKDGKPPRRVLQSLFAHGKCLHRMAMNGSDELDLGQTIRGFAGGQKLLSRYILKLSGKTEVAWLDSAAKEFWHSPND
jgi:hypothetical protein